MDHALEKRAPTDWSKVGFDRRLMTPERLVELAGDRPVTFTTMADGVFLDCAECGKGITRVATPDQPVRTTPVQLMSDTLRHWVNVHGVSLSGRPGDG